MTNEQKRYAEKKKNGLCVACRKPPIPPATHGVLCESCWEAYRYKSRLRRESEKRQQR